LHRKGRGPIRDIADLPRGLTSLDIDAQRLGLDLVKRLAGLGGLRALLAPNEVWKDLSYGAVGRLTALTTVKYFGWCGGSVSQLLSLPDLKHLCFQNLCIYEKAVACAELSCLARLDWLDLDVCTWDTDCDVGFLGALMQLERFLSHVDGGDIAHVAKLHHLCSLNLTDREACSVARSQRAPLDLGSLGQELMRPDHLQALTHLVLWAISNNSLRSQDLRVLSRLPSLASLNFEFGYCDGLDAGCLKWLKGCTALTLLRVCSCMWFGLKGLASLHKAGIFDTPRYLDCRDSRLFGDRFRRNARQEALWVSRIRFRLGGGGGSGRAPA